jgi:hypothetical protein
MDIIWTYSWTFANHFAWQHNIQNWNWLNPDTRGIRNATVWLVGNWWEHKDYDLFISILMPTNSKFYNENKKPLPGSLKYFETIKHWGPQIYGTDREYPLGYFESLGRYPKRKISQTKHQDHYDQGWNDAYGDFDFADLF